MKMKKITIGIAGLALVSATIFLGCKKKRSTVEYDLNYSTNFVFSAGTVTTGVNYIWTPVTTNIQSSLDANKLNGNIVGEITCTAFNMNIKGPTGANVSVLKDYEFYMAAGTQKEVRVAYCQPWASGVVTTQTAISSTASTGTATPITMQIEGTNLKNYFLESAVKVKMKTYPTATVSASTYTVNATYTVHVKGIQ